MVIVEVIPAIPFRIILHIFLCCAWFTKKNDANYRDYSKNYNQKEFHLPHPFPYPNPASAASSDPKAEVINLHDTMI